MAGKEADDNRLMTEAEDAALSVVVNQSGAYRTVCVEIELDALAVNTLLQSHHVNDIEGTAGSIAFDAAPHASLEEMLGGQVSTLVRYYIRQSYSHSDLRHFYTVDGMLPDRCVHF